MDGLKRIPVTFMTEANISTMRAGDAFGEGVQELESGNMIPRLCTAAEKVAGSEACRQVCQLNPVGRQEAGVLCAENNIRSVIDALGTTPDQFVMVGATADEVGFGFSEEIVENNEGYMQMPGYNAFFFRPGIDGLSHAAMRMADCGAVIYEFEDRDNELVVGIAHFSRTNMRGPSAYEHELNGRKVSWAEFVLGSAMEHYQAEVESVRIELVAAVEGKDFIHHYEDQAAMDRHYPGWKELGFMHPAADTDFDCLIDYCEMIEWQLGQSIQSPMLRQKLRQIRVNNAINTGDLSLGHASHHWASKGAIAHGRDMYVVGLRS